MMSMFRKFSQLLRTRVCGVLFTICLISPLFVISASAYGVEFFSEDGESYGVYYDMDNFSGSLYEDELTADIYINYFEYSDSFTIESNSKILGWSMLSGSNTVDFSITDTVGYSDLDPEYVYDYDYLFPLYLVTEYSSGSIPAPSYTFKPLAKPSGWDDGGNYSVSGYCDYTLFGDPDIETNTQLFPISYPSTTQIVELASQYNTFRPQITLQFATDYRDVYYNLLVRQAWYVDGEIPANIQVNDVGLEGTLTFENTLSSPTATSMYSIYSFDNSIDCTTSVDRANGIIYFDYRISVYISESIGVPPPHSGHKVRFDLKHKNTVSGLSIDTERSYTTLVSAYGDITEEDALAQVKYEAYRDKSNEKMEQGEEIVKEIESLVKPDPEQIAPDKIVPNLIPVIDPDSGVEDIVSPIFQNAMILQLCSMVLGFAFVSYVLFGKKG